MSPPPERTAVDRLMKRCQIGVGPRQMGEAHDIMAECYGTLGRQQIEIEQLRAALAQQAEPLTIERLRDALVASRIIPPAAVEDPDGYDDGVTLFRIEALHRRIT